MLEVLIVRGYYSKHVVTVETHQYRLGNCTTDIRLRAATELINEDEAAVIGILHHVLHVEQMAGVGGEVIINALLIADVYENAFEYARMAVGAHGYGNSALEHVLQQSYRLEAD